MPNTPTDPAAALARFISAQDGTFDRALGELRAGRKRGHWMWFVFPQLAGLGRSAMAQHYGIADLAEARAYLAHPVLGPRLAAVTDAMLMHGGRAAQDILGELDAQKFRSSMTLFEAAGPGRFGSALDTFYDGRRCPLTLRALAGQTPGD